MSMRSWYSGFERSVNKVTLKQDWSLNLVDILNVIPYRASQQTQSASICNFTGFQLDSLQSGTTNGYCPEGELQMNKKIDKCIKNEYSIPGLFTDTNMISLVPQRNDEILGGGKNV